MGAYQDWQWATETLATARNKSAGKPVQNNTRLFQRSDDSIAVKLHAVDVVTINADGTWTLRAEGWHTVTTLERIRGYSPAQLFSERGEWYLRLEPNENDPRPSRYDRTVPKPYTASDPGPEPVKSSAGCVAGQLVTTEHVNEIVDLMWRKDMLPGDEVVEVTKVSSFKADDRDYDSVKVRRSWNSHVWIGEGSSAWNDDQWSNLPDNHSRHSSSFVNDDNETVTYVQCSHCKAFDAEHERWRYAMHGSRWGTRFDGQTSYATYREMLDTYGSMEAWQEAYIADFRARREYLAADKEWDVRNRVPFYDGITVDSHGFAPRLRKNGPSPAKLRRHEKAVAKMKKRIDKYANGFVTELKKGTMPMPSGGDCWYCSLVKGEGVPMGDAMDTLHSDGSLTVEVNTDHLLCHLEESYYVPSLAVNALRERGRQGHGHLLATRHGPEHAYDG